MEHAARDRAKAQLARGHVQAGLQLDRSAAEESVSIDHDRLQALIEAGQPYIARGDVAAPHFDGLLAIKGVLTAEEDVSEAEAEGLQNAILQTFDTALSELKLAREEEGAALHGILSTVLDEIGELQQQAVTIAASRPDAIMEKFRTKLSELLKGELPEDRLAQEAAILAVKADIREELDRLTAHIESARELLAQGSPVGRKLDFLSQEFNREVNTLCSKSGDSELTRIGLAMKAAVDQFREQVQNVE